MSATSSFSLSPHCIFHHGSAKSLAESIDYFIEHPAEHDRLSKAYAEEGGAYHLEKMVDKMEVMFQEAIADYRDGLDVRPLIHRARDYRKKKKIFKKLIKKGVIDQMPILLRK